MLRRWSRSLIDLFYPNACVACGAELAKGESQICTFCRWDMPFTEYQLHSENYVTELFAARFPFENACALLYFRGGSDKFRRLIHSMKYSSRRDVAYSMGLIFGTQLIESDLYRNIDLLIPIPLHWTRRIIRGYNQSEEICRGMAVSMGVEYDFGAVRRTRITAQQARRATRRERWKNVSGAFSVVNPKTLRGKHILLVDDVLTTGSTLEACAEEIVRSVKDVKLSIGALSVAKRNSKRRSPQIAERTSH